MAIQQASTKSKRRTTWKLNVSPLLTPTKTHTATLPLSPISIARLGVMSFVPVNVEPGHSSDVLADLRVNVTLEGSEKVLWFNERFPEEEEIIEHLVHNETRRSQWTMHRPRKGVTSASARPPSRPARSSLHPKLAPPARRAAV
ncbi:hypothetical protein K438DRAFT_1755548 [Mycena galopus ATCC 62051]|nr:hypothetical protein K438DRAFT_1755548 [Mycena galopus ATCC 62051]